MRAYITGVQRRTPARAARTPAGDPLEFGAGVRESCAGVPRVGRWSPGRSSLESGRASSALRVLALWSSVFSIPDSSDFALESSGSSLESGLESGISDRSPVIHPPESGDFGLESGARELGVPGYGRWWRGTQRRSDRTREQERRTGGLPAGAALLRPPASSVPLGVFGRGSCPSRAPSLYEC